MIMILGFGLRIQIKYEKKKKNSINKVMNKFKSDQSVELKSSSTSVNLTYNWIPPWVPNEG